MGERPSQKFENGVLVERALSTEVAGDPDEQETATEPGRRITSPVSEKQVDAKAAENKAVKKADSK